MAAATGPALVSAAHFPDAGQFKIRGLKNGKIMQECQLTYVCSASVAPLISAANGKLTLHKQRPNLQCPQIDRFPFPRHDSSRRNNHFNGYTFRCGSG